MLYSLIVSVILSVFAICATLIITTQQFRSLSLLGITATLLFSAITDPLLYLGVLTAVFGKFGPFGSITKIYCNILIRMANMLSSVDGIYCTTSFFIVEFITTLLTVCLVVFFIVKLNKRYVGVVVLSAMLLSVFSTAYVASKINESKTRIEYHSGSYGDRILLTKGNHTALLDISHGDDKAARETSNFLSEMKIYDVDKYFVMTYHSDMLSGIPALVYSLNIDMLYIPTPINDEEKEICSNIRGDFSENKCNTEIVLFDKSGKNSCEDFTVAPLFRSTVYDTLAFTIFYDNKFYSYLSSGMLNDENKIYARQIMDGADTVIFGKWGEKSDSYDFIDKIESAEQLIFSDKNMNIPDEVLTFYASKKLYFTPERINLIH